MKRIFVLLAGGSGKRAGFNIPKQFIKLNDKPVFMWSLDVALNYCEFDMILFVVNKRYFKFAKNLFNEYGYKELLEKKLFIVEGGDRRQFSSLNALNWLKSNGILDEDIVFFHDAARPFLKPKVVKEIFKEVVKHRAVSLAFMVEDTIAFVSNNKEILDIPNRSSLMRIQTPQAFIFNDIYSAHIKAWKERFSEATDDAGLILRYGGKVKIVLGYRENIKLTYPFDFEVANLLAKRWREFIL